MFGVTLMAPDARLLTILFEDHLRSEGLIDAKLSASQVMSIVSANDDDLDIVKNFVLTLNQKLAVSDANIDHNVVFGYDDVFRKLQLIYNV